MDLIKALWRGDVRLVRTYWVYGLLMWNLLGMVITILEHSLPPSSSIFGAFLLLIVSLFALVYFVISYVAIWRSASKYEGNSLWAWLARLSVVVGVFMTMILIGMAIKGG